jgi:hypothetical protein
MAKNTIKAKNTRKGSNKATGRDYSKEKGYQSTPARKRYRAALNKANRKEGTYGNGDKKDMSHTKSGKLVKESQSKNRARNRGKK